MQDDIRDKHTSDKRRMIASTCVDLLFYILTSSSHFLSLISALTRNSPEGSATQSGPLPTKGLETPRGGTLPVAAPKFQDDGKGGLTLRGVAVTTETAMTAMTAKSFKSVTVARCLSVLHFIGPAKGGLSTDSPEPPKPLKSPKPS